LRFWSQFFSAGVEEHQGEHQEGQRRRLPVRPRPRPHSGIANSPRLAKLRHVSSQPKVTSETITGDSRKESRRPNPIPERDILLADDFGSRRTLASPLAGRQLPVVSAYARAKDSFTAVRCPTRSLSQISQSKHPAAAGFFVSAHSFFQIPVSNFRSHLCPKIKSATPSPIRK
jgi:hypothetical protein